jgi:hypothetical protein
MYHEENILDDVQCNPYIDITHDEQFVSDNVMNTNNNLYICEWCNKQYKHRQTLSKHKKSCKNKSTGNVGKILNEMKELKLEIQMLKSNHPSEKIPTKKIITKNNSDNNNSFNDNKVINNQKTINSVAYINLHYTNTEPLKPICPEQISKMIVMLPEESGTYSFCEFLIFNYEKGILHEFLGKIIISVYKKEDPEEQQFWATDVARLTFVVRQVLNKGGIWLTDKKGTHITDYIITPFLEELTIMLVKHIQSCRLQIIGNENTKDVEKFGNQIYVARQINLDISLNKLHTKILAYITPKFQLGTNQTTLKLLN